MDREDGRRRTLYLTLVSALVLFLAYLAREAVVPLLVALLLAYVLAPVVATLEKRGFSRMGAVVTLFVAFFGSVGTALAFGLPPLIDQGRALVRAGLGEPVRTLARPAPASLAALLVRPVPPVLEDYLKAREALDAAGIAGTTPGNYEHKEEEAREAGGEEGARLFRSRHKSWLVARMEGRIVAFDDRNHNGAFDPGYVFQTALALAGYARDKAGNEAVASAIEDIGMDAVPNVTESLASYGGNVARGALGALGFFLTALGWAVIVPLYTFFFLMRLEDVWNAFVGYLPGAQRDRVVKVLLEIHRMLIGFFRGRLLTMLIKGIYVGALLGIVGTPYWPVFGAAAGLLTIVPAVGPLAAGVPAVYLAYTEGGSTTAILAAAVLLSAEIVEGYVLIPKLIGKEVGLHPMAVISAILIGSALLGLLGILIAIPLAAAAKIVWGEFVLPALRAKAAEKPGPGA
jgi:predicted PurR-regulated permease PerM